MASYETIFRGATVVDPTQGLDDIVDVAVSRGEIVAVEPELDPADAQRVVDVDGYVLVPGIIDSHVHAAGDRGIGLGMMARVGVTTAIDFSSTMGDLVRAVREWGPSVNVGAIHPIVPGYTVQNEDPDYGELRQQLDIAMSAGSLGLKLPGGHSPLTPAATQRVIETANERKAYVAFHVGTTRNGSNIKGLLEVEELLGSKGRLHIAHVNSYCRGMHEDPADEAQQALAMIRRLKPRVVSESYLGTINGTGGRCKEGLPTSHVTRNMLELGGYEPTEEGLEEALRDGYAMVYVEQAGETVLISGEQARSVWQDNGTDVGISFPVNSPKSTFLLATTRDPDGGFVVDAISTDGGAIPRNLIVERGLALVRYGALSLFDFVMKTSIAPADMFGMARKGSLKPGMDADITVLDVDRGVPVMSVVNGEVAMIGGVLVGDHGKLITTEEGESAVRETGLAYTIADVAGGRLYRQQADRAV